MIVSRAIFFDANAILYVLDETSDLHNHAVGIVQSILDKQLVPHTSHHIIEEVLHITQKIPKSGHSLVKVVREISRIPNLVLVEPPTNIDFAKRYAGLSQKLQLGVNDALILQLMLDADIKQLFSYDKKLSKQAEALLIEHIP